MNIPIFRSAHEGYGDARRVNRRHAYHRNARGWDPRWPGELRIAARLVGPTAGAWIDTPISAIEWKNSTTGAPLIIVTAGAMHQIFQDGTFGTTQALTAVATGACLHDDGSGVPYLYTGYTGDTSGAKVQRRAIDTTLTTMTNLVARKLLSLGGDLYGTRRASSSLEDSQVWKIAAGTSITTGIAMPAGTTVGFAGYPINNLAGVLRKIVALKPEGVFTYDRGSDQWINHARWLELMPHPDNGKAYWYEGDALIVALGNGGALRFDGESAYPYDLLPAFETLPDENTTPQIIAAGGSLRHWGVAVTKIGAKRMRFAGSSFALPLQPVFLKSSDAGATYPDDYTNLVRDFDPTSAASLNALSTTDGRVVILCAEPFAGFYLDVTAPNGNAATMAAEIWNGSAWVSHSIVGRDFTSTSGVSLARAGWVIFGSDPVVAGWAPVTINSWTGYSVRLSFNATLSASVSIAGVDLIPWRPAIDPTNSDLGFDSLDRAGTRPHMLLSRLDDAGRHVVHDLGALGDTDEIGAVIYGRGGTIGNDERSLLIFGRRGVSEFRLSVDDRPQMAAWQQLASSNGLIELSAQDIQSLHDTAGPYRLESVRIDGDDWHATGYVYARWLNGQPWTRIGTFDQLPATIDVHSMDVGRWLQFAIGFTTAGQQAQLPGTPRIYEIDAEIKPAHGTTERRLGRQTPAVS